MNKTFFVGRITADPILKHTQANATPVCTFTLAVDRPTAQGKEKETDWLVIVAWRSLAEFVSRYITKGRKLLVVASARTRSYKDENGKNHTVTEFYADEIQFCDSKPTEGTQSANQQPSYTDQSDTSEPDDLPF